MTMIVKCENKKCSNFNIDIEIPDSITVICGACNHTILEPTEEQLEEILQKESNEQKIKEAQRQALLDKLGITADEAKLLLG